MDILLIIHRNQLKQLGEIIKESKTALNKEIGTFDEADISAMLDEVKQLSSFVSDKKRVENVEILIPFAKVVQHRHDLR